MARLIVLSGFAYLLLAAACVDTTHPAKVAECVKLNRCTDQVGSRGGLVGGSSAGSGGSTASSGGGGMAGSGGISAETGGTTGAGGAQGGKTDKDAGAAGSGGAGTGGAGTSGGGYTGSGGGGSAGSGDAGADTPSVGLDCDTNPPLPDAPVDVPADQSRLDTGTDLKRDTTPDLSPDRSPDLTPDTLPPGPETGADAPTCLDKLVANGYAVTGAGDAGVKACGDCTQKSKCETMIDCLQKAGLCLTPGKACWTSCLNQVNGDMVLGDCVIAVTNLACRAP